MPAGSGIFLSFPAFLYPKRKISEGDYQNSVKNSGIPLAPIPLMLISSDQTCLLVKDYVSSLSMPNRHTAPRSGTASPAPRPNALGARR